MKKKSRMLAMVLALVMLLAACGTTNQPANNNPAEDNAPEEVTLRFSWWGGDERHESTLAAIKLFEEKNPSIKISAEYGGWTGHQEKVTTQILGNTAPDILQVNWNWLWLFSKDGNGFYDMNELKDIITLSNYDKSLLDQMTINGKLNGLPVGVGGKVFYFNETTYQKAGLEIPKTFDDLFTAAEVFKTKLGKDYYPFDFDQYNAFLMILYYLEQQTGKPFIVDNKVAYTKDELIDGLNFYQKMVDAGVTPSLEVRGAAGNVPVDQTPGWIQGKYGGTYEWDSAIQKFQAALEGEQKIVAGDYLKDFGPHSSALAKISMGYAINKNTQHPEAAAKFLEFLTSDPEATEILGTSRGIPANLSALKTLENKGMLASLTYDGNVKVKANLGKGISPYFEDAELQAFYRLVMEEFGYKKINATTAAENIITTVNTLVAELSK